MPDCSLPPPEKIKISPGNVCDLRCPLCPTGLRHAHWPAELMSMETFRVVLGKIGFAKHVSLFNSGEPFLNPNTLKMLRLLSERGITSDLHSHFSLKRLQIFFNELVASGLTTLLVSLDGASQESYAAYRQGGSFDLVLANIRTLIEAREKKNSDTPKVIWKFIVNKHNEHEVDKARSLALEMGASFILDRLGLADDLPDFDHPEPLDLRKAKWLPRNPQYLKACYAAGKQERPLYTGRCEQLFTSAVIKPDGRVVPCCWVNDSTNAFGDLLHESFEDIWHNEKYRFSRSLFEGEEYLGPAPNTVCLRCNNFPKLC